MWIVYVVLFAAALAVSTALTYAALKIASRVGFVDNPSSRKLHANPVPLGGGLAIIATVFGVLGLLTVAALVFDQHPEYLPIDPGIRAYFGGAKLVLKNLVVVAVGGLALMVMGLIDDKRGLSPMVKLSVQVLVAALLVKNGISITLYLHWQPAGWIATVVWMVFVMNSFNLLDNMDGLSSGVAVIIGSVFFVVAIETGQFFIAAALVVFVASVLGFMVFNFPPARIFMGDTGSYFLGYILGVTAVTFTFIPVGAASRAALFPVALPFILFAIPFYDTLSVICIRIREGRHPFSADKRHFSHRLTDLGMTRREAVITIYVATLTTAFPALYLYHLNTYSLLGAVAQALFVLLLVAMLEHAGARKNRTT